MGGESPIPLFRLPSGEARGMIRKEKLGILLILIGIGIPLISFFFQEDGNLLVIERMKTIELTPAEIETLKKTTQRERWKELEEKKWTIRMGPPICIRFKPFIGVGIFFVLIGLGLLIFSFFPKIKGEKKSEEDGKNQI